MKSIIALLSLSILSVSALNEPSPHFKLVKREPNPKSSLKISIKATWSNIQATVYGNAGDPKSAISSPSCWSNDVWNPSASSAYVIAVSESWDDGKKPKCGDYLQLSYKGKKTIARVADTCSTCKHNGLDLTPKVFTALGSIEQGVLNGVKATKISASKVKWSKAKYGPKRMS